MGVKSRGIYESPGMELLGQSYEYLLQFILDRRARELFDHISQVVSVQIYQGYWLDLATRAALAALEPITQLVTGTISVRLHKGRIYFDTAEDTPEAMPHSLVHRRQLYGGDGDVRPLGRRGVPAGAGHIREEPGSQAGDLVPAGEVVRPMDVSPFPTAPDQMTAGWLESKTGFDLESIEVLQIGEGSGFAGSVYRIQLATPKPSHPTFQAR